MPAAQLPELATLNLRHNRLRSVPVELLALPKLVTLRLGANALESLPPVRAPELLSLEAEENPKLPAELLAAADAGGAALVELLRAAEAPVGTVAARGRGEAAAARDWDSSSMVGGLVASIGTPGLNAGAKKVPFPTVPCLRLPRPQLRLQAGVAIYVMMLLLCLGLLVAMGPNLHIFILLLLGTGIFASMSWFMATWEAEYSEAADPKLAKDKAQ